jgi:DNA-binding response OmpR family regulator
MPAQVLLADDDPLLLDLLRRQLSSKRFDVLTAPDGAVALELAEKHRPDVVVLDERMPKLSGFDVLRAIRADPALARTLVIMLTARRRQEDVLAAFALGAHDYVAKPFRPEDLIARIRRLALHVW